MITILFREKVIIISKTKIFEYYIYSGHFFWKITTNIRMVSKNNIKKDINIIKIKSEGHNHCFGKVKYLSCLGHVSFPFAYINLLL